MSAKTSRRSGARVHIRAAELRRIGADKFDLRTYTSIAKHLNMDATDLSRLISGRIQPSGPMIADFLLAFGEPFEALFEVRPAETPLAA